MLAKAKQIRQNELKMWFIIFICLSSDNNEQVRKGRHKECVCVCVDLFRIVHSACFCLWLEFKCVSSTNLNWVSRQHVNVYETLHTHAYTQRPHIYSYICQWQPQIKGQLNTTVFNGNRCSEPTRFSLVVIVSFNMILISAQKYATVFELPHFVVECLA